MTPRITVVMPVHNRKELLGPVLSALHAAADTHGAVEVVLVDHGSTDGASELLEPYRDPWIVKRFDGGTIAAVRNFGARQAPAPIISFLDADCIVPRDYFTRLEHVFAEVSAGAAGCEVGIPANPHWSERVWYRLHVVGDDGFRHYINSANFAVRHAVFTEIGGFDERLVTGEDTDICTRIRMAGHTIYESHVLNVIHLGNPKSLGAFYRKQVWHGLGGFSRTLRNRLNKATVMVTAHAVLTVAALLVLVMPSSLGLIERLVSALALVLVVPSMTVAFRLLETRRLTNPVLALVLYVVYFFARVQAMVKVFAGATRARLGPRPDSPAESGSRSVP